MTNVAALIADMVRAGVDPELIGRAAEALSQREPVRVVDEQAERRRAKDRDRKRLRNSAESAVSVEGSGLSSPEVSPQTPFPKPLQSIPPSPPKGGSSPAGWVEFWSLYPHKVGKPDAMAKFVKALLVADLETIMAGLRRYVAKTDDRPWCNPATWLYQQRWGDEPAQVARGSPGPAKPSLSDAFGVVTDIAETRNETRFSDSFEGPQRSIPYLSRVQAG